MPRVRRVLVWRSLAPSVGPGRVSAFDRALRFPCRERRRHLSRFARDPTREVRHVEDEERRGSLGSVCRAACAAAESQETGWRSRRHGRRSAGVPWPKPLLTAVDPRQFGTQDHTITVLSAAQFRLGLWRCHCIDPVTLSRLLLLCPQCLRAGSHYYTTLDLPAGSVIDFIGVNTATTVDAAMGFTLHFRDHLGGTAPLASFSFPAHELRDRLCRPPRNPDSGQHRPRVRPRRRAGARSDGPSVLRLRRDLVAPGRL